jgi:hypothetical protein
MSDVVSAVESYKSKRTLIGAIAIAKDGVVNKNPGPELLLSASLFASGAS